MQLNSAGNIDVLGDFDKASFDYFICTEMFERLIDSRTILADLATFIKSELNRLTFGLLEGWLTSQWLLMGKAGSGHPNEKK